MLHIRTIYTYTCDRCGKVEAFDSEIADGHERAGQWKDLNAADFFSCVFGARRKPALLCPECLGEFQDKFMSWLPPMIKEAFEK